MALLATVQDPAAARRFRENGVDVRLAATPPYPLRWRAWRSLDNPAGTAALLAAVDEFAPAVVHVHNLHLHLGYAALGAVRARGVPTILHVHDIMPVCHQKMFCHLDERLVPGEPVRYRNGPVKCALCVRGRYNPLRNRTIRRVLWQDVSRLVAVSDEMGAALAQNGLPRATTIWNGLAPERAVPADSRATEALRARLGLAGRPVVFYGGRLDRLKGGLELVRAMEIVRRRVPRAVLLTVGEALPGFAEELSALAERLGMHDLLISAGWLSGEELSAAYALADVVASPSLCFESFGLVNLEAMAAGRPVVASHWGGPADVVVDGETGFLVNPLDVPLLAGRLTAILLSPELGARLGAAGRLRALQRFSLDAQVEASLALYRSMGLPVDDPGVSGAA